MTRVIATLSLLTFLTACGAVQDSRLNPFNWFGRDREERIAVTETGEYVDPRPLAAEVISLKVDRLPGGAIIHAFALPETQGHWEAELVPRAGETPDKGTLVYDFRLIPPLTPQPQGTKRSREVIVGHFVSEQKLLGVRNIQVIARNNRRTVRR